MAHEDRLGPELLAQWERLAQDGLRRGLLEQAWSRRALALVREIRLLRRELDEAATARTAGHTADGSGCTQGAR